MAEIAEIRCAVINLWNINFRDFCDFCGTKNKKLSVKIMNKTRLMIVLLASLIFGACSSSDDDTNSNSPSPSTYTFGASVNPSWSVDLSGSDAAPGWQGIVRTHYESWMYVTVKLQDELAKHASSDDRMVVFIGDEQRSRPSAPNILTDGSVYFVLTIGGNSTDREINIRLCYWCTKLRQLFTIEGKATFTPELEYGNTGDYEPPLLKGSKKYPVQSTLTVNLPAKVPFTPAAGDLVGVFAGNECRGVGSVGKPFTVFRTSAVEALQVRYYSTEKSGIYALTPNITLNENAAQTITFDF